MTTHEAGLSLADGAPENVAESQDAPGGGGTLWLRRPVAEDGPAVTALIASCPPLDHNSAYCNLLQCAHFGHHCVVAERDGVVVGWLSGYRLSADPARFFIWQVAVGASARGEGLAQHMIAEVLSRPQQAGTTHVLTTITRDNTASWALFRGVARRLQSSFNETLLFARDRHFAGRHASEWQAEIGPFELDNVRRNMEPSL